MFASAAETYLQAQSALGAAEQAADERGAPVRWKAVGRAERDVELAEAALREVAVPRIRAGIERESMQSSA